MHSCKPRISAVEARGARVHGHPSLLSKTRLCQTLIFKSGLGEGRGESMEMKLFRFWMIRGLEDDLHTSLMRFLGLDLFLFFF